MPFAKIKACFFVRLLLNILLLKVATAKNTQDDSSELHFLPLFRSPTWHEIRNCSYPIVWSAHKSGNNQRALPADSPAVLACLVDGIDSASSAPLQSLVWTLVNDANGRVTRYSLQGQDRRFQFKASEAKLEGFFSRLSGSFLIVSSLREKIRLSCEYEAAALNATIKSNWLILWGEQMEVQRLRNSSLQCNSTIYRSSDGHRPLALTYSCLGLGDSRLLESAVVAVYPKSDGATTPVAYEKQVRYFSNSSGVDKNFFGVAFDGRIRFGWAVQSAGANATSLLGLTQTSLCVMLHTVLPSGRVLLLNFAVPQSVPSASITVSPEKPLIIPMTDGGLPTKLQLDALLDPLPERTLPCLLLCLQPDPAACRHRWEGPSLAAPARQPLDAQPLALRLAVSDRADGVWRCSAQLHPDVSASYSVTSRPRPAMCGARLPRKIVVIESQSITINCSLCGLTQNSSAEFDVFASDTAANYSIEKFRRTLRDGFVELSVTLHAFSVTRTGALVVLRCLSADSESKQTSIEFTPVNILPLPEVKSLDICPESEAACTADCRSGVESQLRYLGVSVAYTFYIYSQAGDLKEVLSTSGVLNDVRKAAGKDLAGDLQPICKQIFYYTNVSDGLASFQMVEGRSKQLDDLMPYRQEPLKKANSPLMPSFAKDQSAQAKNSTTKDKGEFSSMIYVIIITFGVAGLAILMAVGVGVKEWRKDARTADQTLILDETPGDDAKKSGGNAGGGGKQAAGKAPPSKAPPAGMGAARQADQKLPQAEKAVTVTGQKAAPAVPAQPAAAQPSNKTQVQKGEKSN